MGTEVIFFPKKPEIQITNRVVVVEGFKPLLQEKTGLLAYGQAKPAQGR